MREAMYYRMDNDLALCRLCPHLCKIPDGHHGLCGVRFNQSGLLIAKSYGKITSLSVDPIEKKPLYHFHPGSKILSAGSSGCNMRCGFCQNHHISMDAEVPHENLNPSALAALAMETPDNLGLAFTYNEPLISYEFLWDTAQLIKKLGLFNVIITNGLIMPEPMDAILPYIDAMNIDLKGFRDDFYKHLGGRLESVKEIIRLCAPRTHLEVTCLIIPDENDDPKEFEGLCHFLAELGPEIPLHISRFFPNYQYSHKEPTPINTLNQLASIAKRHLKHVYIGNV